MTTFKEFRDGVGGQMALRLGINIGGCPTWLAFTDTMRRFNNSKAEQDGDRSPLVKEAKEVASACSTGEMALLRALLAAADFSGLADEIGSNTVWREIERCDDQHSRAVAACILRQDEP
jgi:hypothetical protein